MIASLNAFGGVAAFVEEKFRDGIRIFVKVEICCIPSSLNHTFPLHLRLFVVLPNCFGYLLFAQFLRKLICDLKFVISFSSVGVVR